MYYRTARGWTPRMKKSRASAPNICDKCGARLWLNPSGGRYCNEVHAGLPTEETTATREIKSADRLQNRRHKAYKEARRAIENANNKNT